MKIGHFDTTKSVFIIAEIGNNHEGDFARAEAMIDSAAESGADAVKFQTIIPDLFANKHATPERYKRISSFQLSFDQFSKLKEHADKRKILFLSTPFDIESANFLNGLVPAFKIGSAENTFYPLLSTVASFEKPIILSCGAADLSTVSSAIKCIRATSSKAEISLLHCVSAYPTPPEQANLLAMNELRREFQVPIGYSDHTLGIDAAILSVALGARIIEKHFTLSKTFSDFRDHQLSADPSEMKILVESVRRAEILLGDGIKKIQLAEEGSVLAIRRSIVASMDLDRGTRIEAEHLTWTRPGGGLQPGTEHILLGRTLKRVVKEGEMILEEDCV